MKNTNIVIIILTLCILPVFFGGKQLCGDNSSKNNSIARIKTGKKIISGYKERHPKHWGEEVPGVVTGIDTKEKIAFLTLDACEGGFDRDLIKFLKKQNIPATLFVTSMWIDENPKKFLELVQEPLFSIANHGHEHRPLSIAGKKAYGIKGTEDAEEILSEVLLNYQKINKITGRESLYFRSGTAHYDDVAVDIVRGLGMEVIGFSVAADGGGTFDKEEIRKNLLQIEPGGIILAHMNRPKSEIAEGLASGILSLKKQGWSFLPLEKYEKDFIRVQKKKLD